MAGSYMDAPAHRLAYDRDGSVGVAISQSGLITALTSTHLLGINSETESATALPAGTYEVAIIFPIPVDISAIFLALPLGGSPYNVSVSTSKNTSTGVDGTWTTQIPSRSFLQDVKPNYRRDSAVTPIPGGINAQEVVGIKVSGIVSINGIRALHIYGSPSSSATPDRLSIWHPSSDVPAPPAFFDWGNAPRASSADKSFRVKNLSPTLTAEEVVVYIEALTPGVPSVSGMHLLSENGGSTFLTSVTIPSLAPGAISPVLVLRRVVPSNAAVSVWSARIGADVGSWT